MGSTQLQTRPHRRWSGCTCCRSQPGMWTPWRTVAPGRRRCRPDRPSLVLTCGEALRGAQVFVGVCRAVLAGIAARAETRYFDISEDTIHHFDISAAAGYAGSFATTRRRDFERLRDFDRLRRRRRLELPLRVRLPPELSLCPSPGLPRPLAARSRPLRVRLGDRCCLWAELLRRSPSLPLPDAPPAPGELRNDRVREGWPLDGRGAPTTFGKRDSRRGRPAATA